MQRVRFVGFFLILCSWLTACQPDDPLSALQAQGEQLQQHLEDKQVKAVLALLHPEFKMPNGQDAQWLERSMRLAFLRHKHIRMVVLRQTHALDRSYLDRATSQADIAISGAEGLIPERAGHYRVNLQWQQLDGQWRLIALHWE